MAHLNIVIVDGDPAAAALAARELKIAGLDFDARRVDTEAGYREALHHSTDTIVCSERVPNLGGLRALDILREEGVDIPVIMLARTRGEEAAVDAMKRGAADYLLEERLTRLPAAVLAAVGRARGRTAPQENEHAQREGMDRFDSLTDAVPALIRVSDEDGNCTHVNRGWLEFSGRTLNQELGSGWSDGLHPDDRGQTLTDYAASLANRQPYRFTFRLRRHDGEYRWLLDSGAPHFAADGTLIGFVSVCVDVSDHMLRFPPGRRRVRPPGHSPATPIFPAGTETILVVEDEPSVRMLTSNLLERCGYTVLVAATAREALDIWLARGACIDLLLTDVVIPDDMSGLELAARLKRQREDLPVILISGYSEELRAGAGVPKGATIIEKPFHTAKLAQVVRAALDARGEKGR